MSNFFIASSRCSGSLGYEYYGALAAACLNVRMRLGRLFKRIGVLYFDFQMAVANQVKQFFAGFGPRFRGGGMKAEARAMQCQATFLGQQQQVEWRYVS